MNKNMGLIIGAIVVVVLLVVVATAKNTDTTPTQTQTPTDTNSMTTKTVTTEQHQEEGVMVGGAMMVRSLDIVDNAAKADNVTTLVAAVKAAGLVATLKSEGPFTVFAPTNDAFNKLPAGTVNTLLKPENKATLTKILTYHVVAGRYTSADLKDGMTLKTVEGGTITISMKNGKWFVNNAQILIPDVISSNGVTFVIDSVLMPK